MEIYCLEFDSKRPVFMRLVSEGYFGEEKRSRFTHLLNQLSLCPRSNSYSSRLSSSVNSTLLTEFKFSCNRFSFTDFGITTKPNSNKYFINT